MSVRDLRVSLVGTLVLLALLVGCDAIAPTAQPTKTPGATTSPTVQTAEVKRGNLSNSHSYSGNILAARQVTIVPKVGGRVTKVNVDAGSIVNAGDTLGELDQDFVAIQVDQAEAALAMAQSKLTTIKNGARPEQVAQAEAGLDVAKQRLAIAQRGARDETVAAAQANYDAAKAKLDEVKKGASVYDLEQARLNVEQASLGVDQAKTSLSSAKTTRDGVCKIVPTPPATPVIPQVTQYLCDSAKSNVAAAENGVLQAQKVLQQAQAVYSKVKAGATPEQIAQASAAVRAAQASLDLAKQPVTKEDIAQAEDAVKVAEAALSLVLQPTTQQDQDAGEAGVAQAQAALGLAKLQLAESAVKAPFGGIVSQRLVSEGSMAGPTTPLVMLMSSELEAIINVEEGSLGALAVGQTAQVTTSAYPNKVFDSAISIIAPSLDPRSRTVQVRLKPSDSEGKLRDGMFAQVQLSFGGKENVLLVPRSAVVEENGQMIVYVVGDGVAHRQVVKLGDGDTDRVEIVEGLVEGQRVAISGLSSLKDNQAVATQ